MQQTLSLVIWKKDKLLVRYNDEVKVITNPISDVLIGGKVRDDAALLLKMETGITEAVLVADRITPRIIGEEELEEVQFIVETEEEPTDMDPSLSSHMAYLSVEEIREKLKTYRASSSLLEIIAEASL